MYQSHCYSVLRAKIGIAYPEQSSKAYGERCLLLIQTASEVEDHPWVYEYYFSIILRAN